MHRGVKSRGTWESSKVELVVAGLSTTAAEVCRRLVLPSPALDQAVQVFFVVVDPPTFKVRESPRLRSVPASAYSI